MKSSAETKSATGNGFKLSSINEHRLSVGLLVLLLLCGAGYLIWLGIASFIPEAGVMPKESRRQIAEKHVEEGDVESAVEVYNAMLKDDPENGFAAVRIAQTWQNELIDTWGLYSNLSQNTGNARAADELLKEENRMFKLTIEGWERLRDNARYQRNAYEQMACLHGRRSIVIDSSKDVEKAVTVVKEMLGNGLTTGLGISKTNDLRPLRDHPDFAKLVAKESRIKSQGVSRSISNRRRLGF